MDSLKSEGPAEYSELETNYKAIMGSFLKNWKNTGRSATIADLKKWKKEELHPKYNEKMQANSHPSSFAKFFQLPYINLKNPRENSLEVHPEILAMAESFMENSQDPARPLPSALCEYILFTQKQSLLDSQPPLEFQRFNSASHNKMQTQYQHKKSQFQRLCNQMKNGDLSVATKYRVYKTKQIKWKGNYSMQMAQAWGQGQGINYSGTKDLCIKADINFKPSLWDIISFVSFGASAGPSICQRSSGNERKEKYSRNSSTISLFQSTVSFTATQYQKCQHIYIKAPSDISWWNSVEKTIFSTLENWPGLFICSGNIETTPLHLNEKFGYIHQIFTGLSDMADTGEMKNHPWVIPLRSQQDIHHFLKVMKNFAEVKEGISLSDLDIFSLQAIKNLKKVILEEHGRLNEMTEKLSKYSNEQDIVNYLKKVYKEKRTSAYPGFYTVPDTQELH